MSESSTGIFTNASPARASGAAARRAVRLAPRDPSGAARTVDERALVARTLAGDPAAFVALVDRHHPSLLRLARALGHEAPEAEEIATASWSAILDGLARFHFDCSLRTWMMRVVASRAMPPGDEVPASRADEASHGGEPKRFDGAGRWIDPPAPWGEPALMGDGPAMAVSAAISKLPPAERAVLTLRDVEGLGAEEACAVLDLDMTRQRSLLHRGRERVRRAIEHHLRDGS